MEAAATWPPTSQATGTPPPPTLSVSSQHRRITPSTPASPKPSTMSRVRRKGTSSGVFKKRPWRGGRGREEAMWKGWNGQSYNRAL